MEPQHEQLPIYRFLVIGRMGDGKSSLCKYLTGEETINISSKIESCTHSCKKYQSIDKLNQKRGFIVEVLDTPGLDSNEQNMLKIVIELADIFKQTQYINGILYAVSMGHSRDETISWFLNFLRLYFNKEQLSTSIIPILTHYDKILFEDDEKVMQMKNSRKQAIIRMWGDQQSEKEVINFWDNHLEWINDANQKAAIKEISDFKQIYLTQVEKLIEKAKTIKLPLKENSRNFQENLISKISQGIIQKGRQYETTTQQVSPIKFKVNLNKLSFWKTLGELQSTFSKVFIGTIVVLGLKGYAHKKYKSYEKSMDKVEVGLFQSIGSGIAKIMQVKFTMEFFDWLKINTSSTSTVQDLNRVFSKGGMCHVHIILPQEAYFGVQTIELCRLAPEGKEPIVMLPQAEKNRLVFQDHRRMTDEDQRIYEFRNIKIIRPADNLLNNIIKEIIRSN